MWNATEHLRIALAGMGPGVQVSDLSRRDGVDLVQHDV
jgi:hypothetical protein